MPSCLDLTGKRHSGAVEVNWDSSPERVRKSAETLVGAVIEQAFTDGMRFVQIGYDNDGATFLRYHSAPNAEVAGSWSMSPPPAECYSHLVQAIISLTDLTPGVHLVGELKVKHRRLKNIHVEIHALSNLMLELRE
jgi:hypothetical protein